MTLPFDYSPTILSQFANSPTILGLIDSFSGAVDPAEDIDNFYFQVWDIDSAQGFGLDIWGRIVGVGRVYPVAAGSYFGFHGSDGQPFNTAPFYNGQVLTQNYALSDTAYRTLILAKALANISDGSIPSINNIMMTMFPDRGNCYVATSGGMAMVYTFTFALTPVDLTLVLNSGVLPEPTGISISVAHP